MFRLATRRLAVSSYALFMMEQKNNEALDGLDIAARGRMTAKLYHALSPKDLAALERRAARHAAFKRKTPKPRRPSRYALFVRRHMQDRAILRVKPSKRFAAVAKLWRASKQTSTGTAAKTKSASKRIKRLTKKKKNTAQKKKRKVSKGRKTKKSSKKWKKRSGGAGRRLKKKKILWRKK